MLGERKKGETAMTTCRLAVSPLMMIVGKRVVSELFEYRDALAGIGVGAEERVEEAHHAARESLGMDNEELGYILTLHTLQAGGARYLAQC